MSQQAEEETKTSSPPAAIVKSADMPEDMQAIAIQYAIEALEKNTIEKDIASYIKKEADKKWGPTWHVVVGRSFGSYVTHTSGNFIYMYINQLAFLVFKAG